ncbi:DUF4129 domain-containing protein [Cellulomonas fimi]|uniref:Protein-glutamine gamma-glutamyltransferase-like C-terminal domain-containing protein n=1 Tax=Cellulomonas fimi (strain ATCC 484 / DSM 20113 / JCM 1341 / CCUG 24087 / LMG 16345 / NBRC 15513 / NCIMB 8980 / NCTC 7547 / NRS-133) TaxID=590998 RepID=F4H4C5_CELFA|nr:DUF4129 domain-containing protein [Cellulomonas fimi]AEE46601.1 hypothetical protein Celf_2475 [Cellulomonas fimi ATCC 484]VEH33633.1 Uncharacterised protein [Cellulomonas fimi]
MTPVPAGLVAALRLDVPVQPDAPTARRWAEEELQQPEYHRGPSLLSRLLTWLREQLDSVPTLGLPSGVSVGVVVALAVVVTLGILWFLGPVRRSRRAAGSRAVLADDDTRTAAELRASADAAAAAGDWHRAVLDRFRAVVRALEERTVLDERPGRTAHEAVADAGRRLPTLADDLRAAGDVFDDVAYGDGRADADDDRRLRDLDERVRRARPVAPADADREQLVVPS